MNRIALVAVCAAALSAALLMTGTVPAEAHVHVIKNPNHEQQLANGQNHPAFQAVNADGLRLSCEGVQELPGTGPAGYGLETAHHGPDSGEPGKADGCFATVGNPVDNNPAID